MLITLSASLNMVSASLEYAINSLAVAGKLSCLTSLLGKNGKALGSHIVRFLIQTSQEETPGGHIYSVLEGDGIYVPTEVSNGWNVEG